MFHIQDSAPDQNIIDQLEWDEMFNPSRRYDLNSWEGMDEEYEEDLNAGQADDDPFINRFAEEELDEEEFTLLCFSS